MLKQFLKCYEFSVVYVIIIFIKDNVSDCKLKVLNEHLHVVQTLMKLETI